MHDYNERCYQAAKNQGLATPALRLAAAGYQVSIDQTGGFTMCLRIQANQIPIENRRTFSTITDTHYVWVTSDSDQDSELEEYLVGLYDSANEETDGQESIRDQVCEGQYLIETVAAFLTGRPHWNCHRQQWMHPTNDTPLSQDECESFGIDGTLRDR